MREIVIHVQNLKIRDAAVSALKWISNVASLHCPVLQYAIVNVARKNHAIATHVKICAVFIPTTNVKNCVGKPLAALNTLVFRHVATLEDVIYVWKGLILMKFLVIVD
jgi:hypothetical protein